MLSITLSCLLTFSVPWCVVMHVHLIYQKEDENEGIISWVSKGMSKIINIRY